MCHSCACDRTQVVVVDMTPITARLDALEALMAASQADVLTALADVSALVDETNKDVQRVITKLDAAIAAGDMTAVSDAVAELKSKVQAVDDAAEVASPEPVVEQPPTEEPAPTEPSSDEIV